MNIIFLNWACHCAYDTCMAFSNLGHNVNVMQLPDSAQAGPDEVFMRDLEQRIKDTHCDIVFTLNYFPTVSIVCQKMHCHYISWMYDNPQLHVYDKTVTNDCNLIFTFDSHMEHTLRMRGVDNIYYAPMAVNVQRLTSPVITPDIRNKYSCEVSFVGSLYDTEHNFYDRLLEKAKDPYLEGYLEAVLEAQKRVFGYNFMAESLTPAITATIRQHMPFIPKEGSLIREEEVYADYYLARKLALTDRLETLYTLGEFFDTRLYTYGDIELGKVKNCGKIDYNEEMPYLFRLSKVNLNISLRSIKNGIPLRAMDILGCGGFLLTNFQEDFLRHFEDGKHFVSYTSLQDALEKCDYYIEHDELRQQIADNAKEIMSKEHTFEIRLQQMLNHIQW